ncbi:MAG TPA: molybdate ABC transporter substrate-binding protein [Candidatus Limnocylindrales bacterium]|nr:molybdate ABC transporter substrate-binding protein [Candidatus Limnocylindrales bacterium]
MLLIFVAFAFRTATAEPITVAAAADLNYAMNELAGRFETATGTKVTLSFGASGNLFSQIQSGAPFDLFFSADEDYSKKLVNTGVADASSLRIYALGHLVLWVPNNSSFDPQKLQMELLNQPGVTRIAIANPEHAPYGRAAMTAIEHYGLIDKLAGKLVFGENVSQAAQFVQSGNAQAGLIAMSLAKSPAMESAGRFWVLPSDSYPELKQAAVIVSASKHKKAAQAFMDFVLSPEGAATLRKYGLTPPAKP